MRQKAKNAGKEGVKGTWREIARFEFAYSVPGEAGMCLSPRKVASLVRWWNREETGLMRVQ